MNFITISSLFLLGLFIIAQFGHRIPAKDAFLWWTIGIAAALTAVEPTIWAPVSQLLGFEVTSNFILSSACLLLLALVLRVISDSYKCKVTIQRVICDTAARDFESKHTRESLENNHKQKVLITVPCYNEQENILDVYKALKEIRTDEFEIFVCIVNDSSTDDCRTLLKQHAPKESVEHVSNLGVSGVLQTAWLIAKRNNFDYVLQFDGDGQHPSHEVLNLLRAAKEGDCDLLIGSRYVSDSTSSSTSLIRSLGTSLISICICMFSSVRIKDSTSGFRVYSKRCLGCLLGDLPDQYPEPETIALLLANGFKVSEYPVKMLPRLKGRSSIHGLKSMSYMIKVTSALIGLKMRTLTIHFLNRNS